MQIEAPNGREFLDEIVEHCQREFSEVNGLIGTELWKERILRPHYQESALYAVDGGSLAGFVLSNRFKDLLSPHIYRSCREGLNLSGRLRKSNNWLSRIAPKPKGDTLTISEEDYYLDILVVLPEYRGQGLATQLVTSLCDRLVGAGAEMIFSHAANPASKRVHEKAGFQTILYKEHLYRSGGEAWFMGRVLRGGN